MTRGKVLWWSLLLALFAGGIAVVVVASIWGGAPMRELPLVILNMLVGGFLPPVTVAVLRRAGATPSRPRAGQGTTSSRASSPAETSDGDEFVSETRSSEGGLKLFCALAGLFSGGLGLAMLVSPEARASIIKAYAAPDVLTALPLAGFLLLVAVLALAFAFSGSTARRYVTVGPAGTAIAHGGFAVNIPWSDVDDIDVRDDLLLFRVPTMERDEANRLNNTVSLGAGRDFRAQLWTSESTMIAICDLKTLTVGREVLLKKVERYSGRSIPEH